MFSRNRFGIILMDKILLDCTAWDYQSFQILIHKFVGNQKMAFIFEKDRGLCSYNTKVLEASHLGPGRYVQNEKNKMIKNYAPFLST